MSEVRLILGDCLKVLPTLADASVAAIITDPPYSSGGQFRGDRTVSTRTKYQQSDVLTEHPTFSGDNRDQMGWSYWCALWLSECRRVCIPGGMLCMFTDWRQLPTAANTIQAGGWVWRGIAVWDKVMARPMPGRFRAQAEYIVWATNGPRDFDTSPGAEYLDGVFRITTPSTDEREHSTQKPVELMRELCRVAPVGSTILDPFLGSGTTGVAAVQSGRSFIGCEIEPVYKEIAERRIREAQSTLWTAPTPKVPDPVMFEDAPCATASN